MVKKERLYTFYSFHLNSVTYSSMNDLQVRIKEHKRLLMPQRNMISERQLGFEIRYRIGTSCAWFLSLNDFADCGSTRIVFRFKIQQFSMAVESAPRRKYLFWFCDACVRRNWSDIESRSHSTRSVSRRHVNSCAYSNNWHLRIFCRSADIYAASQWNG